MRKVTLFAAALGIAALIAAPAFANHCSSHKADAQDGSKGHNGSAMTEVDQNIVETAVAAGNFTTLVAAVKAAGLADALSAEGPFTVFAPTDEAFAKLPEGTVESLLADPDKLTQILTYHVLPGIVTAEQVVELNKAETLQGQDVKIKARKGNVTVDAANVVQTDIFASNGVIHVIDEVIMPEMKKK